MEVDTARSKEGTTAGKLSFQPLIEDDVKELGRPVTAEPGCCTESCTLKKVHGAGDLRSDSTEFGD